VGQDAENRHKAEQVKALEAARLEAEKKDLLIAELLKTINMLRESLENKAAGSQDYRNEMCKPLANKD